MPFTTTRDLNHTPATVFAALSDPACLALWWGPAGFSNVFSVFEFREGGRWVFDMIGPDGAVYANESVFTRLIPDREVVLRHLCQPFFSLVIQLEATAAGTRLRWTQTLDDPVQAEALRHVIEPANEQNLDRLGAELDRQAARITVETLVPAPVERVWQAYTTPEDIVQWNAASEDWHTTRASVDLRVGGEFSSRMEAKDGSFGFDFAGIYTQVMPQQLLAYRFGDRTAEVTFTATPAGTRVRVSFDPEDTHPVTQQRDGWQAILDNFARYVGA